MHSIFPRVHGLKHAQGNINESQMLHNQQAINLKTILIIWLS